MRWNIAAECISLIILLIIWFYSRKSNLVPSLKNRLFQGCFFATFCAMSFNIASTLMLFHSQAVPWILTWFVTTVYFIATPLMGMSYFFYVVSTVFEADGNELQVMKWTCLPGALYLILVLVNPFWKELFSIDRQGNYTRGSLIITTYLIFYLYCMAAVVLVLVKKEAVDKSIRRTLAAFPIVAVAVIVVQQLYPNVILSGSAATCALLLIYLYLQNKQNTTDYLTGLPNRQEFLKMLELQMKRSEKFAVAVISLRGFRRINDAFGQHKGDSFLKAIGAYLSEMAGSNCLYRYGGDEFAILVQGQRTGCLRSLVEKLLKRSQETWGDGESSCLIPSVIGVVQYPESAETVEGLINGIEYAVSRAKKLPGENVYYCGKETLQKIHRRLLVAEILEDKLKHDSFEVYYQPIVSTATGEFVVAESLLRISESPLGPLYPNEFIPIAEDSGLIIDITYQVLNKVCRFVNRLAAEGIPLKGVHVNFSGAQFTKNDLAEKVMEIIESNGTPYSSIKIEITESILAENPTLVNAFAAKMHEHEVLMELDDFGTGYSNIVSVMNLPLDMVKIDKSMIWSAIGYERAAVMVKSITRIFHDMDLMVLAEGVENEEQRKFVEECGIDFIQGYLFARPMPEEETIRFLKENISEEN